MGRSVGNGCPATQLIKRGENDQTMLWLIGSEVYFLVKCTPDVLILGAVLGWV